MGILDKFSLQGKTALVTGAGRGIGRAFALALAEAGADVAAVDLDGVSAKSVAEEVRSRGRRGVPVLADVTDPGQVARMVDETVTALGGLNIDVNNAGIGAWAAAEEMTLEEWNRVIAVNLAGVFLCAQACARIMIRQGKGGKIINTASMSGTIVNRPQKQAHYNASKAAVIHLTRSLAAEWAPHRINVNSISPGYTLTPLVEQVKELHPEWLPHIPWGRLAAPEDLQGALIFLASGASDYVTGHDLIVDGGYTVW